MAGFIECVDRGQSVLFPDLLDDWIGKDILDHSLAQRGGHLLLHRNLLYDGWEDPDRQPGKASHQEQR